MYHSFDPTPARKEKARAAAEAAIRLQPDLPEAHLALGFYYYYCERNYQRALDEFAIAKRSLPNSADVYMAIGAIERRQGKWAQSTANLEKAASLGPKDAFVLVNLADNYRANRNFEAADKIYDRAIDAAPESFGARAQKAELAVNWKGDLSVMESELAQVPPGVDPDGLITFARVQLLMLQRRFPEALMVLKQLPQSVTHDKPRESLEGALYIFLKWCARVPMTEGGMRSSVLFWPDWIVKKKRFLKANAPLSCCPSLKMRSKDQTPRLRLPKFTLGQMNPIKHFNSSTIR